MQIEIELHALYVANRIGFQALHINIDAKQVLDSNKYQLYANLITNCRHFH